MQLTITTTAAFVLTIWYIVLSSRTILQRRARHINLGDGGDPDFRRVMRAHANASEYIPIMLVLVFLAEQVTAYRGVLMWTAAAFVAGRIIHGFVFAFTGIDTSKTILRVIGMALTLTPMLAAAVLLVL